MELVNITTLHTDWKPMTRFPCRPGKFSRRTRRRHGYLSLVISSALHAKKVGECGLANPHLLNSVSL